MEEFLEKLEKFCNNKAILYISYEKHLEATIE